MPPPLRYCIERDCQQFAVTGKNRCAGHLRLWNRDRIKRSPQRAAYADPAYKAARARLRGQECALRLPGCERSATTINHIRPLSKGGSNTPDNWEPSCSWCNSKAGNRAH